MNILNINRQPAWTRYLLAKMQAETESDRAAEQAMREIMQRLRGTPSHYHAA